MNYYKPKIKVLWRVRKQAKCSTESLAKRFSYHKPVKYEGPREPIIITTLFAKWSPYTRNGINIKTSKLGPTGSEFPLSQVQHNDQTQRIAKGWKRQLKLRNKNV